MTADWTEARLGRVRSAMSEQGFDALIVAHPPNARYLTGFTGSSAILLLTEQTATLFSDFRYRDQAESEVGSVIAVEIVDRDTWASVLRTLQHVPGISEVGYEAERLTASVVARLNGGCGNRIAVRPTTGLVEAFRNVKDSAEVASIAAAAQLATQALEAVLPLVRVDQTELAVAADLERELRVRGSEWHPFPTIVASGPRSALPHANTSARMIQRGDWLLLDFGAQVDGYCADITRTVVVGDRADDRQRAVYQLVREAQRKAITDMRPGMTGEAIDALARSVIEDAGFGDAFGHSLGHGLGLEVHEGPRLSASNEAAVPEDVVVTVEPGIYLSDWGGVRIEDDVHLTAGGAVLLSDGKTELRMVGCRW